LKSLGKYITNVQEGILETVKEPSKTIYLNQNDNILIYVEQFLLTNGFKITNVSSNDPTNCEFNVHFKRE
jgi:hypothetical protein